MNPSTHTHTSTSHNPPPHTHNAMQAGALWTEEQLALYGGGKGGGRSWFHFEMKDAVDSNNRPSRAVQVNDNDNDSAKLVLFMTYDTWGVDMPSELHY